MSFEITPEMEKQRQNKDEKVTTVYIPDLDMMSIDEVIKHFQTIKELYGEKGKLRLDFDYDDYREFKVLASRPETDEELRTRLDADGEAQRIREEREKAQLKILFEKYGPPV